MIGADLDHRQRRRQRAACHHVFGADHFVLVVEVEEISAEHVDRADREMDLARIDQVEVDQFEQGLAQRGGVVIAGRRFGAGGAEPGIDVVRLEEAGLAQRRRHERTREVAGLAVDVAIRRVVPDLARGDALPEDLQPLQTPLRWIAGDDRRIDRADRYPAHPIRLDAGFVQRLIDTGLVGAERAAALQHQRDPVAAIGPPVRSARY